MKLAQRSAQALPGIWATRPEYPFGGSTVMTEAFLVQRPAGNVWIYATSYVGDYVQHIEEMGGVTLQLLNHRDEASPFCNTLQAPVFCHEMEKEAIQDRGCVVGETYNTEKFKLSDDLVAYHTPGHALGVTSYLWTSPEGFTVLFTGDTLYANIEGNYNHGPLRFHTYPRNKEDMIKSFELFLDLNPSYIISGLTESTFVNEFDPDQVRGLIDELKGKDYSS